MANCFVCCDKIPEIKKETPKVDLILDENEDGDFVEKIGNQDQGSVAVLKLLVNMFSMQLPLGSKINLNTHVPIGFCMSCTTGITQWGKVLEEIIGLQRLLEENFQQMENLKNRVEEAFGEFNYGTVGNKLQKKKLVSIENTGGSSLKPPRLSIPADIKSCVVKLNKVTTAEDRLPGSESLDNATSNETGDVLRPRTRGLIEKVPKTSYIDDLSDISGPELNSIDDDEGDEDYRMDDVTEPVERKISPDVKTSRRRNGRVTKNSKTKVAVNLTLEDRENLEGSDKPAYSGKTEETKEESTLSEITEDEACDRNPDVLNEEAPTKKKISDERPFKCSQCGKGYKSSLFLQKHMQQEHPESEEAKRYRCDLCGEEFATNEEMMKHSHRGEKENECGICKKQLQNSFGFRAHVKIHFKHVLPPPVRAHKCDKCDKTYTALAKLQVHEKSHVEGMAFGCDICGKRFKYQSSLREHTRIHLGHTRYECNICGKKFFSNSNFNTHKLVHTGAKPHLCQICGKRYGQRSHYTLHLKSHATEKPHHCEICGKGFIRPEHLKIHVNAHAGMKNTALCPICGKTLCSPTYLRTHMRIHGGEKPHECKTCGKNFANQSGLRRHMKKFKHDETAEVATKVENATAINNLEPESIETA